MANTTNMGVQIGVVDLLQIDTINSNGIFFQLAEVHDQLIGFVEAKIKDDYLKMNAFAQKVCSCLSFLLPVLQGAVFFLMLFVIRLLSNDLFNDYAAIGC